MNTNSSDPASAPGRGASRPGDTQLDDLLDELVADYADQLNAGRKVERKAFLERVPAAARPGLERCLKMIDAGLARPPAATAGLAPGLVLDHYTLIREVGRGGMALVWLAQDLELKRPVALKILRPGLALEASHTDRFRREGLAIARLKHPHIVQIHGVGEAHGYHYLAMEYVEGPSLATVIAALDPARVWTADDLARATGTPKLAAEGRTFEMAMARLLAPVAEALAVAHESGLVHRDVKPSNILLHSGGRAVVADFGLAKSEGDLALSLTGDALGTPFYMSPEQAYASSKTVDHRTDVYSLGVTLYEALSGRRPFGGDSFLEVVEAIRSSFPPSLGAVVQGRSKDAIAVVARAMEREPEDRYDTARALHADLVRLAHGETTQALQERGSGLRRAWSQVRLACSGQPYEYRSTRTLLGWPLLHANLGLRRPGQPLRHAKGWLAFGDVAVGVIACGRFAAGLVAIGALSLGFLFSWGAVAVGLACFGGIGLGGVVCSGLGVGYFAFAGIAVGYLAVGGIAHGHYAVGGRPEGEFVIGGGRRDQEAVDYLESTLPDLFGWLRIFTGDGSD